MKTMCIVLFFGTLFCQNVLAAIYGCSGSVDSVSLGHEGRVALMSQSIYGNNTGRTLCSTVSDYQGMPPDSCKSWLSLLLSAYATRATIWIQYSDNYTCTSQPGWTLATRPNAIRIEPH